MGRRKQQLHYLFTRQLLIHVKDSVLEPQHIQEYLDRNDFEKCQEKLKQLEKRKKKRLGKLKKQPPFLTGSFFFVW